MKKNKHQLETEMLHFGYNEKDYFGSMTPPIFQTSTFVFDSAEQGERRFAGEEDGYIYSRLQNPTVKIFEERMAFLEKGEKALAFASGMAAVSATLFALIKSGDHILCSQGLYGCTFGLLQFLEEKFHVEHDFSKMETKEELEREIRDNTACIYVETPINPTMKLVDLEMVASVAKKKGIPVVVDNTFSTPYLQRPLELGCDVVVHSATKYIGGHGDVIGGVVVGKEELIDQMAVTTRKDIGGVLSPFDAWLMLRGLQTMPVRLDRHCENARQLSQFLKNHPKVDQVFYPGDPENEQYSLMKKQMDQPGAMISFSLKGTKKTAQQFMNDLQLVKIAVSLGDTVTLIQHPATMTHAVVPEKERRDMGIGDTLLRLSVGLEAWEDIREDLAQALDKIK